MTFATVPQSNPNDELTADLINRGPNAVATVVNGNLDDSNISQLSGTKITSGTLPYSAFPSTQDSLIPADGWVPANETWTFATATTFTVAGDQTAKYGQGVRLKFTQSATVKYAIVRTSTYSAPNTTVQILASADSIANAAISANFYSRVSNPQGVNVGDWWEEIGRTTLGSASASLTVDSLPARSFLKIILRILSPSTTTAVRLRFNNDSGNNYAYRVSQDGGADTTASSQSSAQIVPATSAVLSTYEATISNGTNSEKVAIMLVVRNNNGAGSTPSRDNVILKWANTANQISRIDVITSTGTWGAGSELIVLGHD